MPTNSAAGSPRASHPDSRPPPSRPAIDSGERALWGLATLAPRGTPHSAEPSRATGPLAVEGATLLCVTGDADLRAAIERIARMYLFEVIFARDAEHALSSAFLRPPDGVLVELDDAGLDVANGLRGLLGSGLPCSFVANQGSLEDRVAAAHAGATLFLSRPIDAEILALALRQMMSGAGVRQALVLADDDERSLSLRRAVERRRMSVFAAPLAACFDSLATCAPDVVVIAAGGRTGPALDVCRAIRTSAEWQDVALVVAGAPPSDRLEFLRAGADDFAPHDVAEDEIAARAAARAERARRLRERLDNDALTGLLRRRGFIEGITRSYAECARHGRPMAVALCDVDHFKAINDRYGHLTGDHVLAALGRLMAGSFRAQDLRGRWGGEEFILAFPGESARTVREAVEAVLRQLSAIPFVVGDSSPFHVTFSGGVASAPADGDSIEALLRAADRRLYEAKRGGRARVVADG